MTAPGSRPHESVRHPTAPLRVRKLADISHRSAEVLGALVDASPLLVLIVDEEERLSWMNAQAEKALGWRLEEVAERDLLAELLPERPEYQRALHYLRARTPQWRAGLIRTRAGRRMEIRWRAERLPDGSVAVLAQEERAGRSMASALAHHGKASVQPQKLEAIGRFASGIAHDFNNLLTAIRCGTELLLEQIPQDAPHRDDVREIQGAASRATELVRQLLAFSRRQAMHPVTLDLNSVVRDMEHLLRRIMGEDIEIVTTLGGNVPAVKADPAQLEQVLMNLAVNARDAMPDGGAMVITTERRDVKPGEARELGVPPGSWARLTVADTGHGMDAITREHAFEPFFTTRDEAGGSGLGLSIVYGIVRQSGGLIDVDSELGRGTRFEIHFPASLDGDEVQPGLLHASSPAHAPTAGAAIHAPDDTFGTTEAGGGHTVLLAEDDVAVRSLAARALRAAGFGVLEAADVGEALELWPSHRHDISMLVADMRMPGGGGVRLADSLRHERPELPILFVSGFAESAPGSLSESDSVSFLAKPYMASSLVAAVRGLLVRNA
jgi:two-component system cell cycle sensor histidine kinase/response regulator CckA